MHVPDGFLDASTSISTAVISAGVIGISLQRANREIRQSGPALAGLTSAFVFAVQMVNFPVGAGTSGHLLGGALAAALVGPWTAILSMTVVFTVQALLFADGGITALGTNVLLMGIITVGVGYVVTRLMLTVLRKRQTSVVPAAAIGALVSVPAAALAFTGLYAIGGAAPIPLGTLAVAMVGWHLLIGIGEALITGAVVGAVVATRPDLVYAVRHLRRSLEIINDQGETIPVDAERSSPVRITRRPLATALAATLIVAGGVSLFASAHPDGLESVAGNLGFAGAAQTSVASGSPFADYGVSWIENSVLSDSVAGIVGVLVTIALGVAIAVLAGRRHKHRVGAHAPGLVDSGV